MSRVPQRVLRLDAEMAVPWMGFQALLLVSVTRVSLGAADGIPSQQLTGWTGASGSRERTASGGKAARRPVVTMDGPAPESERARFIDTAQLTSYSVLVVLRQRSTRRSATKGRGHCPR